MDAIASPSTSPPPLPGKKSRWKAVLCFSTIFIVAVVLAVSIFKGNPLAGHEEKLKAIEALAALRYPEQTDKAKPACTDKGFKVLLGLEQFLPASFNAVSAKSNPQFCDVEMVRETAEGKTRIHVRLVKDNTWKFDDVYLNEINGKPCNQWASFACENPILSAMHFRSDEIVKFSKETYDITKALVELGQQMKRLNGEEDNKKQPEITAWPERSSY